jgi:polygalacturonase
MDCYNIHPLIYAMDATNIALSGKGTIDGQASDEAWWWMNGNPDYGWKEGMNNQKLAGRKQLLAFEQNQTLWNNAVSGWKEPSASACQLQQLQHRTDRRPDTEKLPLWVIHP